MQIEQFFIGSRSEFGALFCKGFVPGLVRGEAGGAMFVLSIVVIDFGSQELIGVLVSSDFFIGKEVTRRFCKVPKSRSILPLACGEGATR